MAGNKTFTAGIRTILAAMALAAFLLPVSSPAQAKYASIIVDAKTGRILHATNADTRNYPASLTKTMTLFMIFEALDAGDWTLDKRLKISARAARQPASRLGLKRGQTISVRDAILALVTKSANDVATAVAENMAGSERDFALMMTAMGRKIGMSRTTFRNASGLPHRGQMSTARDMAKLARALLTRHAKHYHYFATRHFRYGKLRHKNHNKLLVTYDGADGIKTGYIRASGFNLMASAQRRGTRLIGVIFGGRSSKHRNRLMTRLLNKGFRVIDGKAKRPVPMAKAAPKKRPPQRQQTARVSKKTDRWGVQVGAYARYTQAYESARAAVDLAPKYLRGGVIKVVPLKTRRGKTLYRSRIHGLDKRTAYAACKTLERRDRDCMELRIKKSVQLAANTRR